MTTERIIVEVSERGAKVVQRNLEDIGKGARSAAGGVNFLKGALQGLALGSIVAVVGRLADSFTSLNNKLKATGIQVELVGATYDRLLKISRETRSSMEASVTTFQRLAKAGEQNGRSLDQMFQFQRSLNQAVAISGANTVEATNALIQFSQGLASGTLRGDELRSVLEQLPIIVDIVADHLGITRGEIRKFAEDGKLTADVVFAAFDKAGPKLAQQFAKSTPTINQGFVVLRDAVMTAVGEMDRAMGVSSRLANLMITLASNVDLLAASMAAAGSIIATVFVARGIQAAITAVRLLSVVILANPITALVSAIAAVISYLTMFSNRINLGVDSITTLMDAWQALWATFRPIISNIIDAIYEWAGPVMKSVIDAMGSVEFSLIGVMRVAASVVDSIIGGFYAAANAVKTAFAAISSGDFTGVGAAMGAAIKAGMSKSNVASSFVEELAGKAQAIAKDRLAADMIKSEKEKAGFAFKPTARVVPMVDVAGKKKGKSEAEKEMEKFERDLESVTGKFAPQIAKSQELAKTLAILNRAYALGDEVLKKYGLTQADVADMMVRATEELGVYGSVFNKYLRELTEENELMRINSEQRQVEIQLRRIQKEAMEAGTPLRAEELAQLRQQLELNKRLNQQEQIKNDLRSKIESVRQETLLNAVPEKDRDLARAKLEFESAASKSGLDPSEQAKMWQEYEAAVRSSQEALRAFREDGIGGVLDGFDRWMQSAVDMRETMSSLVEGGLNKATSALAEMATTGKFSIEGLQSAFVDLAQSIMQAAMKALIAKAIMSAFGATTSGAGAAGAGVGGGGLLGGLLGFANGGEFIVGGSGGTDSKLVAFRATPGEKVVVSTPSQQKKEQAAATPTVVTPPIKVVNVIDPSESLAAMNSSAGERIILNVIERNPQAIQRMLSR